MIFAVFDVSVLECRR